MNYLALCIAALAAAASAVPGPARDKCPPKPPTVPDFDLERVCTAVSSEAWAKLRDWASVAGTGRLLLSGSVAHDSLKTAVDYTSDVVQLQRNN